MRGIKRHSKPTVRMTRAKRACSQSALVEPAVLDPVEELTGSDTEGINDDFEMPPLCHGEPPAWADTRPTLHDGIRWFPINQGGVYHFEKVAYGLLIDADCGDRFYIDDEVIITRIGGNCDKEKDGTLILRDDMKETDTNPRSLIASMRMNIAVGVIIGDRNTTFERKLPHRYNVMGLFRITDIWCEKVAGKVGYKFRLEKLELAVKSWWASKDSPNPPPNGQRDFTTKPESSTCATCKEQSVCLFNEGWTCLRPECDQFWEFDGAPPTTLTYHPVFLSYRTKPEDPKDVKVFEDPRDLHHLEWPEHVLKCPKLIPDWKAFVNASAAAEGANRDSWRGIVCPQCSKCISRIKWDELICTFDQSPRSCGFKHKIKLDIVPISELYEGDEDIQASIGKAALELTAHIDESCVAPYRKITYKIPRVGTVTHFVSNTSINQREGGPDELFHKLQVIDIGLKRFPLEQSVVAGTLTAHFAVNYGMPYKFVVSVDSKGFNEAPEDILRVLGRLSWACEKAVTSTGAEYQALNELLALGYLGEQHIGFHDDGESSLGPDIATLSLGAAATMDIRMKYKYHHGFTSGRKCLLKDDPLPPGCKEEDKRRELKEKYLANHLTREEYDDQRNKLLKSSTGTVKAAIKLHLKHGDLVVMHGEKLQQYYEHAVTPKGRRRFALTARRIKRDQVSEEDHWKGKFSLTPEQKYDGK